MKKPKKPGRPHMSFAEKIRRSARPHETAGEVAWRMQREGASFLDSARYLELCGYRTPSGKLNWSAQQVCFEWMKARSARGLGAVLAKRRKAAEAADYAETMALHRASPEETVRLLESMRRRDLSLRDPRPRQTYPLRTKIKTAKDRARAAWWKASQAAMKRGEAGPPEPLFDSRGRPLKGRRFSKIKRKPA
jgi:hypothetical protein